MTVNTAFFAMD